jgi:CubicO group peptidase (beta-lactamase class C family)
MENSSGLCPERLKNTDAYLRRIVDTGEVAGVSAAIVRRDITAYCKSFGMQDREQNIPMQNDTIFRIYSMTKTFTIVAAMTLYEKGFFKLHDPIAEFLPAFREMKVACHDSRGIVRLEDARRPISFEHLFTMTSGIPYPGEQSYSALIFSEAEKLSIEDAARGKPWTTARVVDEAAKVPLCFHPGEYWMYGFSHDILGRLIEVISGKSLGTYLKDTILDPLGLTDTAFYVPAEKQPRLAAVYTHTESGLERLREPDWVDPGKEKAPPAYESGGGGLVSTLADMAKYGRLLVKGGKLGDLRILSRKTVDLIRQNHVKPEVMSSFAFPQMAGYGYGLGVRTMQDKVPAGLNGSLGEWAWGGKLGTWYCIDPVEDLVAVFLIQRFPGGNDNLPKRFAQTVYGAIDD